MRTAKLVEPSSGNGVCFYETLGGERTVNTNHRKVQLPAAWRVLSQAWPNDKKEVVDSAQFAACA